jgi:F1F0 ATPase subunit 2
MTEPFTMVLVGMAGIALGTLYFGGLWWTLRKALWSSMPAPWFLGSLLVRMTIALVGFYVVSDHHWERLLACLLGFVVARLLVTKFTRAANKSSYLGREGIHAPYSR